MASLTLADRQTALTDPKAAEQARDRTEDQLNALFSKAMRKYLALIEKELNARVRAGKTALVAAAADDPLSWGRFAEWWANIVDDMIIAEIASAWWQAYGRIESGVRDATEDYLPRVRDRLVRGDVWIGGQQAPSVAEDSFDKARVILARSAIEGWSRPQTAERIATAFGWETDGPALRSQLDDVNARIEAILDPLGYPGNPAREYARLNDPHIRELQADRAELVKALDAEKSYWQNRAQLIARTESTSLHGYASLRALAAEGFTHKQWIATSDQRTRKEHREVNGQIVPLDAEFIVGGFSMQCPGDPSAPVGMIANCRCCLIGVDQEPDDEPPASRANEARLRTFGEPPDKSDEDAFEAYWQRRQDAIEGSGLTSNGERLEPDEVQFAERMADAGEQVGWIPKGWNGNDKVGPLPTNDFWWFSRGGIQVEQKALVATTPVDATHITRQIRNALDKNKRRRTVTAVIVDVGDRDIPASIIATIAQAPIRKQVQSLWLMSRSRIIPVPTK